MVQTDDLETGVALAGILWRVAAGHLSGTRQGAALNAGALPLDLLGRLWVPSADATGSVALVSGAGFERYSTERALAAGYRSHPRMRVYEGVDARGEGWFSVTAMKLAELARCRVACSVYESNAGDSGLVRHHDAWLGLVAQIEGSKSWHLGTTKHSVPIETNSGDVLVIPQGLMHKASAQVRSLHVLFAVVTDEPFSLGVAPS